MDYDLLNQPTEKIGLLNSAKKLIAPILHTGDGSLTQDQPLAAFRADNAGLVSIIMSREHNPAAPAALRNGKRAQGPKTFSTRAKEPRPAAPGG